MTRRIALLRFLSLVCCLLLLGCGQKAAPATTGTAALPNLLVSAEGEVWLRRAGWKSFVPANLGVEVHSGDVLRLAKDAVAEVFCGDEAEWESNPRGLPADGAEHATGCQAGRPPRPWADVSALRAEADADIPYVLYPRDTAVLSDRPALRWHGLAGLSAYTVTLIGDDGQDRPAVAATAEQMSWPEEWPALQAGSTYVLLVEGGGRRSDEGNETRAGLGFSLLASNAAETVRAQEERLSARPLSPAAQDLLLAELYRGHGLRAEATQLLETVAAAQPVPAVWLGLGQVYLDGKLAHEAATAFSEGLFLAQANGDLETQAEAQVGLGLAARALQGEAAGQEALRAAQTLYEELGSQSGIDRVEQLLGQ